jgi:hypothetical protein
MDINSTESRQGFLKVLGNLRYRITPVPTEAQLLELKSLGAHGLAYNNEQLLTVDEALQMFEGLKQLSTKGFD